MWQLVQLPEQISACWRRGVGEIKQPPPPPSPPPPPPRPPPPPSSPTTTTTTTTHDCGYSSLTGRMDHVTLCADVKLSHHVAGTPTFVYTRLNSSAALTDNETVVMTSPSLCYDVNLCLTFDYLITQEDLSLQVLKTCGDSGWQEASATLTYHSSYGSWSRARATLTPCTAGSTQVTSHTASGKQRQQHHQQLQQQQ